MCGLLCLLTVTACGAFVQSNSRLGQALTQGMMTRGEAGDWWGVVNASMQGHCAPCYLWVSLNKAHKSALLVRTPPGSY